MSFFDVFNDGLMQEFNLSFSDFRYIVISNRLFYIEGHTGLVTLSDFEIIFSIRKKKCTITGADLKIKQMDKSTAMIVGDVVGVTVVWKYG